MRYPSALLLLVVCSAVLGAEIRQRTFPGRRAGIEIDSRLLKVGVVPAIGGRIVELIPKAVNKNYVRIAPWYFHLGPNDRWEGAEYGGICDTPTDGWPGALWGIEYRIEQHQRKLKQAIKRAQQAVKASEGGQHVRIG